MSRFKLYFGLVILVLAGAGAWYYHHLRTPEYLIRKAIFNIAEDASRQSGETNSVNAFKMVAFGTHLAEHIDISVHNVPISGGFSAEELGSQVARARLFLDTLEIQPLDILITLHGENAAEAECEVQVKAFSRDNAHYKMDEIFHLKVDIIRNADRKWVFTGFHESALIER